MIASGDTRPRPITSIRHNHATGLPLRGPSISIKMDESSCRMTSAWLSIQSESTRYRADLTTPPARQSKVHVFMW